MTHFKVKTRFWKDGERGPIANGTIACDNYEMAMTLNDMLNNVHCPKGVHCNSMVGVAVQGGFGAMLIDVNAIDAVLEQLRTVSLQVRS